MILLYFYLLRRVLNSSPFGSVWTIVAFLTARVQENQRNRLSKFEYIAGDPAGTFASEEVLLTSAPKANSLHAGGWVGFKPSAYGKAVRLHAFS